MAKCGNCGSKLGCSCKRRKASDGKSCCVNCISGYEKKLKQITTKSNNTGVILNVTATQKT
jgi:hypothetical protein